MTTKYLNKCLAKLNKESKEVYVAGDFNIDLLKYESNNNFSDFYNLVTSNGFLPMITQPTRITENSKTLIDNIFSNVFTYDTESGNILIEIADHLTQFISVHSQNKSMPANDFYKRCSKNWNENLFMEDLSNINLANDSNDPNRKFEFLLSNLQKCVDKHMPLKKLTKKEIKMKSKPWITPRIVRKIKHRNSLFARKKLDPNNDHLKNVYNRFRNSVNREIKTSKKKYYNEYFENCKNNMKKTWIGIKDLITSKQKSISVNQIKNGDRVLDDPADICNSFNDFFVNVGPNLDKDIPNTPVSPLSFLKSRVAYDFKLQPTNNADVMILILQLDDTKSSPGIPVNILKIAAPIIVPHIVSIFNLSFETGIFPDLMKLAKVVPIFKSGCNLLVTNYRPISLLPILSKIFERIVHKQLYAFLELHSVIYESQFGFQKNKSTLHSLIEIV